MAKKQGFGDKVKKSSAEGRTYLKIVRTNRSKTTNGIRFNEEMVGVPPGDNVDNFIKKYLENAGKK